MESRVPFGSETELVLRKLSQLIYVTDDIEKVLVTSTALVESYVDDEIDHYLALREATSTTLERYLLRDYGGGFRTSWKERIRFLERGIELGAVPSPLRQDVLLVVDARNAVVHGNGELTMQQVNKGINTLDMRRQLTGRLDAHFAGKRVYFSRETSRSALGTLIDFCYWLDGSLPDPL
ncbi:hypothetical protein [Microbacterium suaedae]|uniref:hypothetical protein n=1 Tax=Microbacterium suaedae TaxID=2067813 RepID=UPI0013A648C5|nr:hypothetical protein [Microbacterium suaedae]